MIKLASAYKLKRKNRTNYRDKLEEEKKAFSAPLLVMSDSIRNHLNSYYSALYGNYQYLDSHTGRTVTATTYRKRLQFAREELSKIERQLLLEKEEEGLDDVSISTVRLYIQSLHREAITNNSYLNKKQKRKNKPGITVRTAQSSLESRVEYSQSEGRATSSPLYDRLREIDVISEKKPEAIDTRFDKIAEEEPSFQKKRNNLGLFRKVIFGLSAAAGAALAVFGGYNLLGNKYEEYSSEVIIKSDSALLGEKPSTADSYDFLSEKSFDKSNNSEEAVVHPTLEESNQGGRYIDSLTSISVREKAAAIARAEKARIKEEIMQRSNQPKTVQTSQIYLPSVSDNEINQEKTKEKTAASPLTARDVLNRVTQGRLREIESRRIAQGYFTVKEVTYFPNGDTITKYPSKNNNNLASK